MTKKASAPVAPKLPANIEGTELACTTVAQRVNWIADVMRRGQWIRGASGPQLARVWGLSDSRVEDLSSEAWRRVCEEADDIDVIRPNIAGVLLVNLERASAKEDFRAVAQVADVLARIVGAKAANRLTEEDARRKYRELTGQDWPGTAETTEEKSE